MTVPYAYIFTNHQLYCLHVLSDVLLIKDNVR